MVSWIKNTASVTASICIALAVPTAQSVFGQDAVGNAAGSKSSVNSLAPEVRDFSVEADLELQRAVNERAKTIAARNTRSSTANSLTLVPRVASLTAESSSLGPADARLNKELAIGSKIKTDPTLCGPQLVASLPVDGPRANAAASRTSDPVVLPPIVSVDSMSSSLIDEAPTVIIRPADGGASQITGCTMEVKKLLDSDGQEYAIWLEVPDSVKVIEVLPSQTADSVRNFRLRLDQAQDVNAQFNAPAIKISSGDQVLTNQQDFSRANSMPQLRSLPTMETENPRQKGFQKNPFFKRDAVKADKETAQIPQSDLEPLALASPREFLQKSDLVQAADSVQAAFNTSSAKDEHETLAAQYTGDENVKMEPKSEFGRSILSMPLLTSGLTGPQELALGEQGNFVVLVSNLTETTVNDVVIQLDLSGGLDVTVLDRDARVDEDNRTVIWSLPTLVAGEEVFIQYRVLATSTGDTHQEISVIVDSEISDECEFDTSVVGRGELSGTIELDYEKK